MLISVLWLIGFEKYESHHDLILRKFVDRLQQRHGSVFILLVLYCRLRVSTLLI